MKTEKITLLMLAILIVTFTIVIDIYVFHELQALDNLAAIMLLILNLATMIMIYIISLFFMKNKVKVTAHE
ncbi:MAG: hypothetical protein KQ78_00839 [Candidatus Izimaplasma bacterium HR2]|nr:MAG: hypothetical protein KQ78_00839 [Candidatus Izimaplasma bacterium HR2]